MLIVLLIGIYGLLTGNTWLACILLLLPIFSPRIVGAVAYLIGMFVAGSHK